jgi:hypothetical protein
MARRDEALLHGGITSTTGVEPKHPNVLRPMFPCDGGEHISPGGD